MIIIVIEPKRVEVRLDKKCPQIWVDTIFEVRSIGIWMSYGQFVRNELRITNHGEGK
jgi:hypothetical protein